VEETFYHYLNSNNHGGETKIGGRQAFECASQCNTDSRGDTIEIFNNLSCPTSYYSYQENTQVNNAQGQIAFTGWLLYMLGAVPSPLAWLGLASALLGRVAESERTLYIGCTGTVVRQTLYCCLADNCNSVKLLKNGSDYWRQPSKLLLLLMLVVSRI